MSNNPYRFKSSTHHPRVCIDGLTVSYLNGDLIEEKGLTPEEVEKIKFSHVVKRVLQERMTAERDLTKLPYMGELFTSLLFYQQKLWHFPQTETMHNWLDIPHCSCALTIEVDKTENLINPHCPVHRHRIF